MCRRREQREQRDQQQYEQVKTGRNLPCVSASDWVLPSRPHSSHTHSRSWVFVPAPHSAAAREQQQPVGGARGRVERGAVLDPQRDQGENNPNQPQPTSPPPSPPVWPKLEKTFAAICHESGENRTEVALTAQVLYCFALLRIASSCAARLMANHSDRSSICALLHTTHTHPHPLLSPCRRCGG